MKLTISRYGYTSKPEPITIKWMQSAELQAKTAKTIDFVLFPKYNIFQNGDEINHFFKFEWYAET